MKKIVFFSVLFAAIFFSTGNILAQNRTDIGFGIFYNIPERTITQNRDLDSRVNEGWGIFLEPQWKTSNNFFIGFRTELSGTAAGVGEDYIGGFDIFSLLLTGKYLLSNNKIPPFIGGGMGFYHVMYETPIVNYGAQCRFGMKYWKLQLSIGYDRVISKIERRKNRDQFRQYYTSIRFGFDL